MAVLSLSSMIVGFICGVEDGVHVGAVNHEGVG